MIVLFLKFVMMCKALVRETFVRAGEMGPVDPAPFSVKTVILDKLP